jgi:hypothetical protein
VAFQGRAARARSTLDVLGDPVLRRVVTGALGLPPQLALQSVEAQARAVSARLEVARLQDPREAARIAERYVLAAAGSASGAGGVGLPGLPTGGLLL